MDTRESHAPTPVTDEELVRRLRDGDDWAGEDLAKRHCSSLLRFLQRLVRSDQLAEELHQQTWTSALENLDKFEVTSGSGGFKAWLYRIATNKAHDHWRSRGREIKAKEGLRLVIEETVPDAAHRVEGAEAEAKLRAAMELLPQSQKEVLLLRYYANLKFVEIAQMLGCPLNTALGRMHKAMIRLRQLLAENEPLQGTRAESRTS
jgi:RNA polymerase sigma-70 factor (ECF subfamily)